MERLVRKPRSIIPALDVKTLEDVEEVVGATYDLPGIGGYKVSGLTLISRFGLPTVVKIIRRLTDLPIIVDWQKGGTDIPPLGTDLAEVSKSAGADAVILFPFGGHVTEKAWIKAIQEQGLVVLVGGHMTQDGFLESEGGFISDAAPERMYTIGVECGVTHFVLPGNKPVIFPKYLKLLEESLGKGNFVVFSPGFVTQGGDITETGRLIDGEWHAIVGGDIYNKKGKAGKREAAIKLTSQIVRG